jgi:cytochrome c oxidase accessory protein FixG
MGNEENSAFRDKVSTIDDKGKRVWIYPKKPKGTFYKKRTYLSYFLLALLFVGPFIKIGGEPLLLLDVINRKFVILGQVFWPEDFHLFVFAMLTFVISVVLFTVVYGRLFCGWVCPQTIFMEMLFRKIEYAIEGDAPQQKLLDKKKGTKEYILKKTLKHTIFYLISFYIANTFLMYIIGYEELFKIITSPPTEHLTGFIAIIVFSFVFYAVFARFREQVCIAVCPYGRLQGVMLDKNSLVVAYDYIRGEKRAKIKKGEDRKANNKGDCIDCEQCVKVCPTGIDIRNGTQMECVGCTACIDACDAMMDNVGFPRGLIKYTSEKNIQERKEGFRATTRVKAYTFVLMLLIATFFILLFYRSDVETIIVRTPGLLPQKVQNDSISNLYNFKLVNKSKGEKQIQFKLGEEVKGKIRFVGKKPVLKEKELLQGSFFITLPKSEINGYKLKLNIDVYDKDKKIETVKTTFLGG